MRREYIDSMPNLHATWLSRLRQPWDAALQALPSQCAVCRRWPAERLCADCLARWAQASHRCLRCALHLPAPTPLCGACLRQPPALAACVAAVDYAYPWQQLIGDFKFRADIGLARSLGRLLAEHAPAQPLLQSCDALIPVPSSARRLRERGFDHTLLLARALSRQLPLSLEIRSHAVQRQHTDMPQHVLSRHQRLRQLRGVFQVPPAHAEAIKSQHLLLFDDVMTTGATLNALAGSLLQAGAASVSALVIARTP